MSSVKQYIKNPKFGQGDEPEFLPVGTTGIDAVKNRLLQVERQELNITIRDKKNYASLTEAIAAVTDDKYKVKGFQLQFSTDGKVWKTYLYNGDDASGWSGEDNWLEVTYGEGGSSNQYLDLSIFSELSGTLSDENYQKVVKAYNDGVNMFYSSTYTSYALGSFMYEESTYGILAAFNITDGIDCMIYNIMIAVNSDKTYQKTESVTAIKTSGSGTKVLTDNGQYAEFVPEVPNSDDTRFYARHHGGWYNIEDVVFVGAGGTLIVGKSDTGLRDTSIKLIDGGSGEILKRLSSNVFYKFGECTSLTITLGSEENGVLNEYMFEFISGSTPTTLADIPNVKWQNGDKLVPEANCTYQVSIVNNCAVYAKFPNA